MAQEILFNTGLRPRRRGEAITVTSVNQGNDEAKPEKALNILDAYKARGVKVPAHEIGNSKNQSGNS